MSLIATQLIRTIAIMQHSDHPLPDRVILRICVILVVVLSILAGYYQNRFSVWRENHLRLLNKLDVASTKQALEKQWKEVK